MPIITSTTSEKHFDIEHGPDPRILLITSGKIAISSDTVELKIRRGVGGTRIQSRRALVFSRIMFAAFPLWLILYLFVMSYLYRHFPLLLVLFFCVLCISTFLFPKHIQLPKRVVQTIQREGRWITLLLGENPHSLYGIRFLMSTLEDATVVAQALQDTMGNLPAPIRIAFTRRSKYETTNLGLVYLHEVIIGSAAVQLNGLIMNADANRQKRQLGVILAVISSLSLSFAVFMPIFSQITVNPKNPSAVEALGWYAAIAVLLAIAVIYHVLRLYLSSADKKECIPDKRTITHADICAIDRRDNLFMLTMSRGNSKKQYTRFFVPNDENADVIEAVLSSPSELTERFAFPATYDVIDKSFFSNYAPGKLTIKGDSLTLNGKTWPSGNLFIDARLPTILSYAGIALLLWALYPCYANVVPIGYKGIIVLLFPLPIMLSALPGGMEVTALFTTISRTFPISEITGLRRLGRQLTLYAPDHTRKVWKYVFYTRSEEEAEALQRALSEP